MNESLMEKESDTRATLDRIDSTYLWNEVRSVLNFDKGVFYTIREILLRPGLTVKHFLRRDRSQLVRPLVFIILCSLVYTLCQQTFNFEDGYVGISFEQEPFVEAVFEWISRHYGYSNILISICMGIWLRLFFSKEGFNFYEILILLCYVVGVGMLFFAVIGIMNSHIDLKIIDKVFFLGVIYIIWAIANFFGQRRIMNYLKAVFAYFLAYMTFSFAAILVGFILKFIQ